MGVTDIIILICFIPAVVRGISKGFIEQLASLAAILLGVWAATRFSGAVGDWLGGFISIEPKLLHIISFALTAILAVIALTIIGKLLSKVLSIAMLGWLDKLLGLVFSLAKAFLIIGLVIILFDSLNGVFGLVKEETLDSSVLYHAIKDACNIIFPSIKALVTNA